MATFDLSSIRCIVFDFDGVMTDNRVFVHQDGSEAVCCHRSDGLGVKWLKEKGIRLLILSTETNPVVQARANKLAIPCLQGRDNKLAALQRFAEEERLTAEEIAYVGNDVNDETCMRWVGCPIAVADAVPEIQAIAVRRTTRAGGQGVVYEIARWMMES